MEAVSRPKLAKQLQALGGRGCEEHTAKSVAVAVDASEVVEHAVARTSKPEG